MDVEEPISCAPFLKESESGKPIACSILNLSRIPRSSSFCLRHSITCRITGKQNKSKKQNSSVWNYHVCHKISVYTAKKELSAAQIRKMKLSSYLVFPSHCCTGCLLIWIWEIRIFLKKPFYFCRLRVNLPTKWQTNHSIRWTDYTQQVTK